MSFPFFTPCLDCWHWQGFRIRCALLPDEPRLLDQHEFHGHQLAAQGRIEPWQLSVLTLELLLDTASDVALPWHWRNLCLDRAWRPLHGLQYLAHDLEQQRTHIRLRNRLATLNLSPSLSFNEPLEGHPYE
ncbi:FagA protein [Pseudomonas sp. PDM16]|uniref:FagA protein n=1 Tax=Pseudomonas sp. PDM16 TaxID=2769292 RepID=UPI00178215B6|nr:FagA protein [Pseudomonas sp. PDM16]MBD9416830.1 FagA protein [Pseudomonas sp. PDM16]